MSYETLLYEKQGRKALITLNRPERFNAIRPPMPHELSDALARANADEEVRVVILQANGRSFCAGYDFTGNLEHFSQWGMQGGAQAWDPGRELMGLTSPWLGSIQKFMDIWRSPKPVLARVHGWCVGGGSDMALLCDFIVASEDARFGTPYARVWGAYLTGMWMYRLGLTRVKQLALTGDMISGREAADMGLINQAVPLEELDEAVHAWADRMANSPASQLAAMKLVVNQAYENMGLQTTQLTGMLLDSYMRHTPEGLDFVRTALEQGVGQAVATRDRPFGDYSQAPAEQKPRAEPVPPRPGQHGPGSTG